MTIQEALRWAKQQLKSSDTPELDARVILLHLLKWTPTELLGRTTTPLPKAIFIKYKKMVADRKRGVPVAYLVGTKEFYGINLKVNRSVLIPRPVTEAIVDATLDLIKKLSVKTVYEIGTGSGAIAVALAKHHPTVKVIASDISNKALNVAKNNIADHKLNRRIKLVKSDLGKHIKKSMLVVANLPYLPIGLKVKRDLSFEPKQALYAKDGGLALYKKLFSNTKLEYAVIELGAKQVAPITKWLIEKFPKAKIQPVKDIDRTIVGLIIEVDV